MQARGVRGMSRALVPFVRGRDTKTQKSKTRLGTAGLHTRRTGENRIRGKIELPLPAEFRKPLSCHRQGAPDACRFPAGCFSSQGAVMLAFVPSPSTCTAPSAGICTGRCRTSSPTPTAPASAGPASAPLLPPRDSPGARCPATWPNWPRRRRRASATPWWCLCLHGRAPVPAGPARGVPPARKGCPTSAKRRTGR